VHDRKQHIDEGGRREEGMDKTEQRPEEKPGLSTTAKIAQYAKANTSPKTKWSAYPIALARTRSTVTAVPRRNGMSMRVRPSSLAARRSVVSTTVPATLPTMTAQIIRRLQRRRRRR
jgi:hypothetical protein